MAEWTDNRPPTPGVGTTYTHNGKRYVSSKSAGQNVWDLSATTSGPGDPTTRVKQFPDFMAGDGQSPSYNNGFAFIDQSDQIRVFGHHHRQRLGHVDHIHGGWLHQAMPHGVTPARLHLTWQNLYVIGTDGRCYASGLNNYKQIVRPADDSLTNNLLLRRVGLPDTSPIKKIDAHEHNRYTTYYLTESGDLYGTGHNPYGCIFGSGDASRTNVDATNNPNKQKYYHLNQFINNEQIDDVFMLGKYYSSIGSAYWWSFSVALTKSGHVYTTGYNNHGERGDGTTTTGAAADYQKWRRVVQGGMADKRIVKIKGTAGYPTGSTYALADDGSLYSWGYNGYGQLGNGNMTNQGNPQWVSNQVSDMWVSGGPYASLFVKKTDGSIHCCGYNGHGQLGTGEVNVSKSSLTRVNGLDGLDVQQIHMSTYDTAGCVYVHTTDGKLYSCGYNAYGQLGLGHRNNTEHFNPVRLPFELKDMRCYTSMYGNGHGVVFASSTDGHLFAAGSGSYRLFGDESGNSEVFSKVVGF